MTLKHIYISIGLILVFHLSMNAQVSKPKYSNEFLAIGVGARASAMGGAVCSSTFDATSVYWNPASLRQLGSKNSLVLQHSEYFAGIAAYDFAGFATQLDEESVIGFSFIRFGVDDIPDTRFLYDGNGALNYDNIRFFSAADHAFFFSYARDLKFLEGLSIGGSSKVIYRNVGKFANAWGFGLDAGLYYPLKNFHFSLVGRDIFGTYTNWYHNISLIEASYIQTGNEIPVNTIEMTLPRLALGVAYQLNLPADFAVLGEVNLETTFDGPRNTFVSEEKFSIDPRFGLEIAYDNMVFLRAGGNNFQQIKNFDGSLRWNGQANMGIGFRYKTLQIDYAYTDISNQSEALYSHVFTLKINWDAKE